MADVFPMERVLVLKKNVLKTEFSLNFGLLCYNFVYNAGEFLKINVLRNFLTLGRKSFCRN
jgi:hypothetical protein